MVRGLVALPLLGLAVSTAAAESVVVEAGSLTTSITEDDCARLVPHVPAPDVEYRPGVDAAGRPVAPADLPGSPRIVFPDAYRIPIEVDLAGHYRGTAVPGPSEATVALGPGPRVGTRLFCLGPPPP